jgi:hypothetical protein
MIIVKGGLKIIELMMKEKLKNDVAFVVIGKKKIHQTFIFSINLNQKKVLVVYVSLV